MTGRLVSDWARVGGGFSVQFVVREDSARLDCSWLPRLPTKREFKRHADRYRQARDAFLLEFAAQRGRAVVCVEV